MKIGGFLKQSFIDYPGKIASVVFTAGCNFRCFYCHNPELVIPELIQDTQFIDKNEVFAYLEKNSQLLDAVVITGGEPTIQSDLIEFIMKIKDLELFVKLDTNGTNPLILKKLLKNNLVDYLAMDLKSPLNYIKYSEIVGEQFSKKQFDKIRESIQLLEQSKIKSEFRTTLVHPYHSTDDVIEMANSIFGDYYLQEYNNTKTLYDCYNYAKVFDRKELENIKIANNLNIKFR